ncbi:MAG: hypothetical protein ABSH04_05800 [Acidimicrobiales bacterium]|jgi:hypothetical protein
MPFRLARVAVVIVLAVAGYLLFMRPSHVERRLVGNLVIHRISLPGLPSRPGLADSISPSTSPFTVVKQAAKTNPTRTGLYEVEWANTKNTASVTEAGILLQLLPDSKRADTALTASVAQFITKPTLSGQTLSAGTPFSIPSVPQAHAESHTMTATSTGKADGYAYIVAFRVDRAVVAEVVTSPDMTRSTSGASSMAQAENALLRRAEPSFSMVRTTTPVVASVIFAVVTVLVCAGAFFLPEWAPDALHRRRAQREIKERERARSQYRARGRRAVRRHRAPAWRHPGRR